MEANLRARERLWRPEDFMKALVEVDSDRVLGFTAFGVEAGEITASSRSRGPLDALHSAARRRPDSSDIGPRGLYLSSHHQRRHTTLLMQQ